MTSVKCGDGIDSSIDEVMNYITTIHSSSISVRDLEVYGWDLVWKHSLTPSVSKYLFEDLEIIENIAPKGNPNRPGDTHEKIYICVHDTGDATFSAGEWSKIVHDAKYEDGRAYEASFQYVVGNDGTFHNIPDDETAYHAGDGAQSGSLFAEYATGVVGEDNNPHVGISTDGFFTLNGEKSVIQAPKNDNGKILTESDINDLGIYTTVKQGQYYIGKTWYSKTYQKISNRGGNLNSIGIESCVNKDTDVYYTWQKLAKLVAYLMDKNNIGIERIVQHHFFSGKDCPMTMRKAGLWKNFLGLVEVEYQMLKFKKQGYNFKFESLNSEYVNEKGRVIYRNPNFGQSVSYRVTVTNTEGEMRQATFNTMIPASKK